MKLRVISKAADIGRFRGDFVDLTTNVVLSIRKDIVRTGSNGAASYIVNLIDKFIKEEREGSQRAKLQAEAEEVEEFEGVEGDERAERAKGTKEVKVKYKGAEETEAGRRKERQGEQGKQESKEKQEKLKKQVKEILSASRKQNIEGRVDQEPERLRLKDMLNEGWDEYFAKSHSQFEPNAEEMFGYSFVSGDVISKDKECVGGVCSGGIPDTFGKTFSASNLGLYGLNSYHGSGGDDFRFSFSHFHHGIAKNLAEVYLAGYHDIDLLGFDFDKSTNKVTPMIEFVVRNAINIPELKHGFTIFTFSDGSQIIIAGYPEIITF